MLQSGDITFAELFKVAVTTHLIGRYNSRNWAYRESNTGEKSKYCYQFKPEKLTTVHLPEFALT